VILHYKHRVNAVFVVGWLLK